MKDFITDILWWSVTNLLVLKAETWKINKSLQIQIFNESIFFVVLKRIWVYYQDPKTEPTSKFYFKQ